MWRNPWWHKHYHLLSPASHHTTLITTTTTTTLSAVALVPVYWSYTLEFYLEQDELLPRGSYRLLQPFKPQIGLGSHLISISTQIPLILPIFLPSYSLRFVNPSAGPIRLPSLLIVPPRLIINYHGLGRHNSSTYHIFNFLNDIQSALS